MRLTLAIFLAALSVVRAQLACSFDDGMCGFNDTGALMFSRRSGETPSSGTGPLSDRTGEEGGSYIYTEASSPNNPHQGPFIVEARLGTIGAKIASFYYSMYGLGMGTMTFETTNASSSSWVTRWQKSGNQGEDWQLAFVDVSDPTVERVRFRVITGTSYAGDAALDDIEVTAWSTLTPTGTPAPSTSSMPTLLPTSLPTSVPTTLEITSSSQLRAAIAPNSDIILKASVDLASTIFLDSITGVSLDGAGNIVSGGGTVACFFMNGLASASFSNLTVSECYSVSACGGAFQITQGASATFTNVVFSDNYAADLGGGACVYFDASATFTNCHFLRNKAGSNGGGFFAAQDAHLTFSHTVFEQNEAKYGGGLSITKHSPSTFDHCDVFNNVALQGGGAYLDYTNSTFKNSKFVNNTATEAGGGIYNRGILETSTKLVNVVVARNLANLEGGGGLYMTGGILRARNWTVINNDAVGHKFAVDSDGMCTTAGCFVAWCLLFLVIEYI